MRYYPAFLDLTEKRCLVAGAGDVGRRKLATLIKCPVKEVLVVDPGPPHTDLEPLIAPVNVTYANRPFTDSDLEGCFLAIAATAKTEVNQRIADLCRERSILCNVIDEPDSGDFIVPAHVDLDGLVAALSSSGVSPALTRVVRRDLQEYLGSRYTILLALLKKLRPLVLALEQPQADNAALFRSLVTSDLAGLLSSGDQQGAQALLQEILPPALADHIPELLAG
ncbi:MAG: bifunctional precorrin-2 dehydrogenase/sirohydrochlorin ferrochelatase [Desulfovibrio sp.]|nr:MAG: bifunctional precorrin-2 dehydrogenase/sirohydrochlorin ferrochelatase [Desulfovibrio sp.]